MGQDNRGHFLTEQRNPLSMDLDNLSALELVQLMNQQDSEVVRAVQAAQESIAQGILLIAEALAQGGRLFYVGAGTSGRLGVLDASECPSTFRTDPTMVQGLIAGGPEALVRSIEGAEDSPSAGAADLTERGISSADVVVGIAAGGTTPYIHGALAGARAQGAKTIFFCCVSKEQVPDDYDLSIRVLVGPEVLTGSTRLKAGTATKMVLNMLSTGAMVRLGKVYQNLMVDVSVTNHKLEARALRILGELAKISPPEAQDLLEKADNKVKLALVMHHRQLDKGQAETLLAKHQGHLSKILRS
ncbi:MAG: N-acetylmuramic acid 6-phosphate etherase [Gloeobacterales cyanobacterium]